MNAIAFIIFYLKPLQIRKSQICSLQSGNYIITLRLYDIMNAIAKKYHTKTTPFKEKIYAQ